MTPLVLVLIQIAFGLLMAVFGYIWRQAQIENNRRFDEQSKQLIEEVRTRKEEDNKLDEKINAIIEAKLSVRQFNEFKNNFINLSRAVGTIQEDIKELLKKG